MDTQSDGRDRCNYYPMKGAVFQERCSNKVTNIDPERKFCAFHRRCVLVPKAKVREPPPKKNQVKFEDFETFNMSCIEHFLPIGTQIEDIFIAGHIITE